MEGYVRVHRVHIVWYKNGVVHRAGRPSVVWGNGVRVWYLDGEYLVETRLDERRKVWKDTSV